MKKTAEVMLEELKQANSLECFLRDNTEEFESELLPDMLCQLLTRYGKKKQEVIRAACLEGTYGYQIFDGRKNPKRSKLLQLAFGFPLSVEDANRLLRIGGERELHIRNKGDAVCMFCLDRKLQLEQCNQYLYELGEATLN